MLGALIHVLDGFARFFLNALNQLGNFLGGLRGFFRQLADFVGHDGKAQTVFSGASRFDGGVQGEQVGLLREIVDDFDDFADIVGTLAKDVDDLSGGADGVVDLVQALGRLVHSGDAAVDFFARTVGDVQQHLGGIGDALDGGDHLDRWKPKFR